MVSRDLLGTEDTVASYREVIETRAPVEAAFDYVADFSTAQEWDPGIDESRRVGEGPTEVGSAFDVVAEFRGRKIPLRYVVQELDPGRRIVVRGEGDKAVSDDTITFEPRDGGSRVTYASELRMKGIWRLAEPFLGSTFSKMGEEALAGLKEQLDRRATAPGG